MIDPAAYLPGTWRVERDLHDAALGAGRFRGSATFELLEDGNLAWREAGRLRLGSYEGPGGRSLVVARAGDGWEVRFPDGRPFHPLDLAGGRCAVVHPCGEDRYEGEYAVEGLDAFSVRWQVRGPGKAQQLETRYNRA